MIVQDSREPASGQNPCFLCLFFSLPAGVIYLLVYLVFTSEQLLWIIWIIHKQYSGRDRPSVKEETFSLVR